MSIIVDGKKLICCLGLEENTLTALQVQEALSKLSEEERDAMIKECTISVQEDRLDIKEYDLNKHLYRDYPNLDRPSEPEIRKRLKYEKNYLAQKDLRSMLGPDIGERGRHSKGRKHKRRK